MNNYFESRINYPENVGILAIELYFPSQYVCQEKLEKFDNVSKGKYTIGLGQSKMGFCFDLEDINSICLTALNNLIEKYNISYDEIGRLDVGTETILDKSKSVKSVLMSLFQSTSNNDVEGVDNINACFGGTAALFNAINWIESSYYDGRYAAVVMGDIALYSKGNARPTGGAGAIALLIGPNAPLVFERGLRSSHISHAYDFYKPVLDSEYPIVDGRLSIQCYLSSLDKCYNLYKKKFTNKYSSSSGNINNNQNFDYNDKNNNIYKNDFNLTKANAFLFHSPYCKLVQKSFGRLLWNDYLVNASYLDDNLRSRLDKYKDIKVEDSYTDKSLESDLVNLSDNFYKNQTLPSLLFSNSVGNMYTPSLYACLVSYLLNTSEENLYGTRVVLFSYGSGFASSMFSIIINEKKDDQIEKQRFTLNKILINLKKTKDYLDNRIEIEPVLYDKYLQHREVMNKKVPREPNVCLDILFPGTWYLVSVDDQYRRKYARKDLNENFNTQDALNSALNFITTI